VEFEIETVNIVSVAVERTTFYFDKPYDYIIPDEMIFKVLPGMRVTVPFGKGNTACQGIIVNCGTVEKNLGLKSIIEILDETPVLDNELLRLGEWLKEQVFCTLFEAYKAMLPFGTRKINDATVKMAKLSQTYIGNDVDIKLTSKQKSVVDLLRGYTQISVKEVSYFAGLSMSVINGLVKRGIVETFEDEVDRNPYSSMEKPTCEYVELSEEQKQSLHSLLYKYSSGGGVSLLYGVTGSGKTQVFLALIKEVIFSGRTVIMMVPEIALTPQTVSLFRARFGSSVAVFHSGLSKAERMDEWKRVKADKAKIVVGTRSAVFAPLKKIGLIIIDEEQEHTYKSEATPRYHARDVARFRAGYNNALLLLASATPELTTYSKAQKGIYSMNNLNHRYGNAKLPEVVTVDMRYEVQRDNITTLSELLIDEIANSLEQQRQVILLLNRRGYNTHVSCRGCGEVLVCENCSISLTYHAANHRLMCHYCGHSAEQLHNCPKCGNEYIRYAGMGTQLVEQELQQLFPYARMLRMDADTTMARFAHEKKLKHFANKEYDVLIGTQMVAKGLDFENVTLVGVLNADSSLYNADYRSYERTFSLLTQVVGRSGRGEYAGKAIVQTMTPDNPVIKLAAAQDYHSFYEQENEVRRLLTFPPYCDLCVLTVGGENRQSAMDGANCLLSLIKHLSEKKYVDIKIIVLGPSIAEIPKVNNKYRYHLTIKCKNSTKFRKFISEVLMAFEKEYSKRDIFTYVDINP